MIKSKTPKRMRLLMLAILVACSAPVAGGTSSPAEAIEASLPPDCLIVISIDQPADFAADLGNLVLRFGGQAEAEEILTHVGRMVNNPTLTGFDLTAPAYFFFMDSKKHPSPWVCQFKISNPEPLQEAVERGELRIDGPIATWGLDAVAKNSVAQWRAAGVSGFGFRTRGQIVLHADMPGLMRVYEDEIGRQVKMMRDRMRRALNRPEVSSGREEAIATAQTEMYLAVAALRQVENVQLSGAIGDRSVLLGIDMMARKDTTLARFLQSHPKGSLRILSRCPGDAAALIMHNLSTEILLRVLGMGKPLDVPGNEDTPQSHSLYAILRSEASDHPMQLLEVAGGDTAIRASMRWKRMLDSAGSGEEPQPFRLRLLEEAPGASVNISFAEIVFDESPFSDRLGRMARYFFGDRPVAAHAVVAGHSILMAGATTAELTRRMVQIGEADFDSLLANKSFLQSIADMHESPNMLAYVSPAGIQRWLSLAGVQLDSRSVDTPGFCAGAAFSEDGRVLGSLFIPLEPVERAIRLQVRQRDPVSQEIGETH